MSKRRKTRRSTSEATTVILEPGESLPPETITKGPNDCSILIQVAGNVCYRVSRHVLGEVSWFKTLFAQEQDRPIYYLPDDEPGTIRILFMILHHRPHLLPISLLVSNLVHLVVVCDKYDVTDIVVPHVEARRWIEGLWEDNKPIGRDWIEWIRILQGFYSIEQRCQKLSTILDVVAANMHEIDEGWIFEWDGRKCSVENISYSIPSGEGII
ncbi:hypothetical protein PtrEW4_005897, partial [Pyrenophora tritici-repentis]